MLMAVIPTPTWPASGHCRVHCSWTRHGGICTPQTPRGDPASLVTLAVKLPPTSNSASPSAIAPFWFYATCQPRLTRFSGQRGITSGEMGGRFFFTRTRLQKVVERGGLPVQWAPSDGNDFPLAQRESWTSGQRLNLPSSENMRAHTSQTDRWSICRRCWKAGKHTHLRTLDGEGRLRVNCGRADGQTREKRGSVYEHALGFRHLATYSHPVACRLS